MNDRYLLILLAVLLVASVGVFFLYVPILPTMAAVVVLIGMVAIFSLGVHVGQTRNAESDQSKGPEIPAAHVPISDVRERFRDVA